MYVTLCGPIIRVLLIVKREYLLEVADIYVGYKVMCTLVLEQGGKDLRKIYSEISEVRMFVYPSVTSSGAWKK